MNDDEHDCEDEGCEGPSVTIIESPVWRPNVWDAIGITFNTVSGLLQVLGHNVGSVARECLAMANYTRQEQELRAAERKQAEERRAMSRDLENIFGLPTRKENP